VLKLLVRLFFSRLVF